MGLPTCIAPFIQTSTNDGMHISSPLVSSQAQGLGPQSVAAAREAEPEGAHRAAAARLGSRVAAEGVALAAGRAAESGARERARTTTYSRPADPGVVVVETAGCSSHTRRCTRAS